MQSICVFCGSSPGDLPLFRHMARELGQSLAARHIQLVYGGGKAGLMGTLADSALAAGGNVVGVIPQALLALEVAHAQLTELVDVHSMHERNFQMARRADAFVALPAGFGNFEVFSEVVTWTQLGVHAKPCGILNVSGYYDPLLQLFSRAGSPIPAPRAPQSSDCLNSD